MNQKADSAISVHIFALFIQVFQDKLNFYANRDYRDVATETVAFVHDDTDMDAAGGPGRAVAFYRNVDPGRKMDDDDDSTSITTEMRIDTSSSLVEKFNEVKKN